MKRLLILSLLCAIAAHLSAQEPVPLIAPDKPESGWVFSNGAEFPGATGGLSVDSTAQHEGHPSLKLTGDFTKGGNYVLTGRKIDRVEMRELSFWIRYPDSDHLGLRIEDATKQTHQISLKLEPSADWQHVVLPLERFFARRGQSDAVTTVTRYESWGGAKDGKWHGPATALYILAGKSSDHLVRTLWLSDIAITPGGATAFAGFKSNFQQGLPKDWKVTEGVSVDAQNRSSLLLARPLEKIERPTSATAPSFAVTPGQWALSAALKTDLNSSDSSYNAVLSLECLDRAGQILERITVADVFGQHDWQPIKKTVTLPSGAASARFQLQLNKTWGEVRLTDLSATYLAPTEHHDDRIVRLLFSTAQLGNLLLPTDPRKVNVSIETRQPLRENQRTISYEVRDYWGAEQSKTVALPLGDPEKKGPLFIYHTTIDLSTVPLEAGRYYEVQAAIPQENEEPFRHSTSFAILPEAETKRYKPEEIPFTSRTWDGRSEEYVRLASRLGVRICGLWGGWASTPPYTPTAPQLDLCQSLGMGWLTNTPCATIESGKRTYDEQALRQGVRNLIEKFGHVRPLVINLGNEPHGTGEHVEHNVAAYRAVYEEVKKVAPDITVVATSVEPNEEYFRLGYGQWCDAFDFHVYETPASVRKTIEQYHALMKKYGCEKPIWSTELGLNSQGQTRHTVAVDVIKKLTTFFAAGGANVSWFGYLYPDPTGKSFGSSGDSHNLFDCRFNCYAPRLDAIAYYDLINALCIKKFTAEKLYADGISATLFRDRDNRCLQVLWKDKGRKDVDVPLAGAKEVQVVRLDGSRHTLQASNGGITLTVGEDPILLLYEGTSPTLPDALAAPRAELTATSPTLPRKNPTPLRVALHGLPPDGVSVAAPPFWIVQKSPARTGRESVVEFTVQPPETSAVREAEIRITLNDSAKRSCGELSLHAAVAP